MKNTKKHIFSLLIIMAIVFVFSVFARAEDDDERESDDDYYPAQTKQVESPAASSPKVETKVETSTSTTILKDSDGDGLLDSSDPHPAVPEIYIVEDNNGNGVVDGFENESFHQEKTIIYEDSLIVDNDLDGLTDEGEKQIFNTDPGNPDTDGDGFYDGAEILGATDPRDISDPQSRTIIKTISPVLEEQETPWVWYTSRLSALVGFSLLWISIFLGLSIRTPLLNRIIKPIYSLSAHRWISFQALIFATIHGLSLLLDKFLGFRLVNVLVPFYPGSYGFIDGNMLGLGIIGLYIMFLLVLSSYFKKYLSFSVWRALHSLNVGLYVIVVIHAFYLGTDMKEGIVRNIFFYSNAILAFLFLLNLYIRLVIPLLRKWNGPDQ